MKRELNQEGWSEVTTKSFKFTGIFSEFQPVSFWNDFVKNRPKMDTRGRNHCERCGVRWSEAPESMKTYFAMTDKGNKVICERCYNEVHQK